MYGRKSMRLPFWDYSNDGAYFITINTKNWVQHFGEVKNGTMGLNKLGCIAAKFWQEIPKNFDSAILDAWVIMPDHLHGIIFLENKNSLSPFVRAIHESPVRREGPVGPEAEQITNAKIRRKMTIPKIIGRFKMQSGKEINKKIGNAGHPFWQSDYYEHIIRNEEDLNRIRKYILNNPIKWQLNNK